MPYQYLYSMLLALCPPLWMATMDELLVSKAPRCESGNRFFFFCVIVGFAYSTYSFI